MHSIGLALSLCMVLDSYYHNAWDWASTITMHGVELALSQCMGLKALSLCMGLG
eukprot:CAMPEP_0185762922 /NCGR_PEP_ID=MMETSP1174-20130828/21894_1 /TAXON_ID=35687 /ORGANISM="Dictyocha speculum, Strain CCMP1381" /LENGTH=53 /DNA_ID=CAMNT_0028444811 /DNA_START=76 /DNA_END=237 /DNA_ORIENTATION=+